MHANNAYNSDYSGSETKNRTQWVLDVHAPAYDHAGRFWPQGDSIGKMITNRTPSTYTRVTYLSSLPITGVLSTLLSYASPADSASIRWRVSANFAFNSSSASSVSWLFWIRNKFDSSKAVKMSSSC